MPRCAGNTDQCASTDLSDSANLDTLNGNQTISGNKTFTGTVDATGSTHSLPAKTGAASSKPATCTVGEMYFATDATAGQNLYLCTATNTWTLQSSTLRVRGLSFTIGDPGNPSALTTSSVTYLASVPFACTISAYNLAIDAGTITVKFWKAATGTAIPTSSNSINTNGVSISSGTAIHSTTLSDFTTTSVAANDIMAMAVTAVSSAKFVSGVLECDN
jgi:hypothetical protein